ncbi:ribonuclease R [Anaeromyxobacter diazotrophicus]|uniref:Ribonuclease R n=1 Tax=Anaeromyxobacter diazotrophicus TaxID=2590199 RepID=A0A7I9VJN1_9BACT|nr:ribonuclease R [Anaeromyxobacter diazotrophicus]
MNASNSRRDRRTALILAQLREAGGKPLGLGEIMQRAQLHPGERTEVKRALRELTREGEVEKDGKRFSVPGAAALPAPEKPAGRAAGRTDRGPSLRGGGEGSRARGIVGTLTRHRDGYGFVARMDRQGEDVFVPPGEARKALDGDLVRIEIVPAPRGRTMGRIVEVVERRRRWVLGTFHARGSSSFVVPSDDDLEGYVAVPETRLAQDGEVVKVRLEPGADPLRGEVVERVGRPGDPRVEVLKVSYAKGFSDLFPDEVRAAAEEVPDHVRPEDRAGRRDLTALPLVTIDGEDARDFDDAVFVERVQGRGKARYRAVVAIADVSHYVRAGSALDAEALRRGTSVYFPAQVLPMLPERLSNGICSLNPDVERLCMVADLLIDDRGEPVSAELYAGVMRSAARCTYTEVARVLDGEQLPHRERFRPAFELMAELQEKLTGMRARRGAIDFDIPESRIVLGQDGRVTGIERRPRNRAHRIVEELMLAANEAVARHFAHRDLPTVYRVHGLPDEEKLDAFRKLARTHGFEVPEGALGPKELNRLLHGFEGHPQQRALNQLLLRAMMQAVYTADNIGHYGLAAEHYLHFTSPIRRYPDLIVHRLLRAQWGGGDAARSERRQGRPERGAPRSARDAAPRPPSPERLEEIATLCSERERAAMQAEREIAAFYAALFMQDKVGERFPGVVASVVEFGIFVEIEPWFVEGLVKAEDLGEAFELDPELHALVQRRTGRAFRVGDRVEVEVAAASPARRQIDLLLVEKGVRREPGVRVERPRRPRPAAPPAGRAPARTAASGRRPGKAPPPRRRRSRRGR